jgi:nucleosome binding factor SPN SPT16 subunit
VAACVAQSAREKDGLFKGADALSIVTGSANEEELYSKSASLQTWLLGYEFPDTCLVIGSRAITILTSAKKGARLHSPPLAHASFAAARVAARAVRLPTAPPCALQSPTCSR